MRRRQKEMLLRQMACISIMLLALVLLPGLRSRLPFTAAAEKRYFPPPSPDLSARFSPSGGDEVLPPFVLVARQMLLRHHAADYAASPSLKAAHQGTGRYQRLLEGLYPLRYQEMSAFRLLHPDEILAPGCTRLETAEEVGLALCRP